MEVHRAADTVSDLLPRDATVGRKDHTHPSPLAWVAAGQQSLGIGGIWTEAHIVVGVSRDSLGNTLWVGAKHPVMGRKQNAARSGWIETNAVNVGYFAQWDLGERWQDERNGSDESQKDACDVGSHG